ncbi:hypothetical protein [Streptomyces niveus]|uniref:Uncharacterized protein n=1 Tax=Streptomyces niveus TaxID=193462 RepID=A0A1U9QL93_STRNV|nr:hypothetical protein [Streptomyces niveus]AQU64960.1 hypothetical protein BBN63_00430 [Streptomyces niveus]
MGDILRAVAGRIADWKLPPVGKLSVFKQELVGGQPRERRVIISDFASYKEKVPKPETCREAVELADTLLPCTPGVTRAVVLVTDAAQLDLWRSLLTGETRTSAVPVVLRRHDRRSLRGWAQRVEMFTADESLERLYALTGSWPLLVDRAHGLHHELGNHDAVLQGLADMFTDHAETRAFIDATGVVADTVLAAAYRSVDSYCGDDPVDTDTVVTAIAYRTGDEEEARGIFTCLDALQVFDRESGLLRLEPLLRQCVTQE